MAYEIHGLYKTVENAAKEVDIIGLKGYKAEDIHVIAKENMVPEIKKNMNANAIGVLKDAEDSSIEALKRTLYQFNVSESQVKRYKDALQAGEILVIVHSGDMRMGNKLDLDTSVLEEDL